MSAPRPASAASAPLCVAIVTLLCLGCGVQQPASRVGSSERASGQPCGPIGYVGCCDGDTLRYCSPGAGGSALQIISCAQGCGFEPAFGVYLCGGPQNEDPSGAAPRACPTTGADGGAGDGGTGDGGTGDGGTGDGGTGDGGTGDGGTGDGGTGDGGVGPLDGQLVDASPMEASADFATADSAAVDAAAELGAGCQGVGYVGCCAGSLLRFCVAGVVLSLDCSGAPSCGWDPQRKLYACATSGGADPSGRNGQACPAGAPDAGASFDTSPDSAPTPLEAGVADAGLADLALDAASDGVGEVGPGDVGSDLVSSDQPAGLELRGFDAVASGDSSTVDLSGGGCSCSVGAAPSASDLPWLLCLLLLARLRRRRGGRR
jgi:MYXO-CTERM domain-containing protein